MAEQFPPPEPVQAYPGAAPTPPKRNRTVWIVVAIIALVLLCCCCLGLAWTFGDQFVEMIMGPDYYYNLSFLLPVA